MGEFHSRDTYEGETTRLYVWYPAEPVSGELPDWENDPAIAHYLQEMRGADNRHYIQAARYYWNPKPTGQLIVIARTQRAAR